MKYLCHFDISICVRGQNKNIFACPRPTDPLKHCRLKSFYSVFCSLLLKKRFLSIPETGFPVRFYLYDDQKYLKFFLKSFVLGFEPKCRKVAIKKCLNKWQKENTHQRNIHDLSGGGCYMGKRLH